MFKQISICALLTLFGTSPLMAQQREAVLRTVELPDAGFNIVLAMPKSPAATVNLDRSPDALVVHLVGGELALTFEDPAKMLATAGSLRFPACAFHVTAADGRTDMPVAAYVVPRAGQPDVIRTASLIDAEPQPALRKVEVPGSKFDIVFATSTMPAVGESDAQPNSLVVYSAGSNLAMAVKEDIERFFKGVGLTEFPDCVFGVDQASDRATQVASVFIVPAGSRSGLPSE
jgi:hypothetical protein